MVVIHAIFASVLFALAYHSAGGDSRAGTAFLIGCATLSTFAFFGRVAAIMLKCMLDMALALVDGIASKDKE